jgi:cold shock CspA family protein
MTEETTNTTYGKEVGNVIWFDQKKGFGFIRIINPESEYHAKELFVHYTSIESLNRFKKLYPGENVSLTVSKNLGEVPEGKEFVTSNVSGLYGSELLVDNPNYFVKIIRKRNDDDNGGDEEL